MYAYDISLYATIYQSIVHLPIHTEGGFVCSVVFPQEPMQLHCDGIESASKKKLEVGASRRDEASKSHTLGKV